jgi:hypothetical protein
MHILNVYTETLSFGERVERPPDLKNLTEHLGALVDAYIYVYVFIYICIYIYLCIYVKISEISIYVYVYE